MPVTNGMMVTAVSSTVYSSTCSRVNATPCVTGSIGYAHLGVFILARDRQRPEMRRRPHEHDEEQQQRVRVDGVRDRGPAEHGRRGAGGAADDDVLRRRALEPHGVDHGVADQRGEREHGGQRVDQQHEDAPSTARTSTNANNSAERGDILPVGSGRRLVRDICASMRSSSTWLITAALAAARPTPRLPKMSASSGGKPGHGQQRAHDGREHDEHDDARLGQLVEAAPARKWLQRRWVRGWPKGLPS